MHKLTHWEYWPYQVIYFPLWPFWLYYAIRCRDLFFFCNANPGIPYGGLTLESKYDIYAQMDPDSYPATFLAGLPLKTSEVASKMQEHEIGYPVIVKPDVGLKALGVFKVNNRKELAEVLTRFESPVLVQDYVKEPLEAGVFYVRFPWEYKGHISGIVSKEFLSVTGDGTKTLRELILEVPRARLQLRRLEKEWRDKLGKAPAKGEEVVLVPFGSHTRGALFRDRRKFITEELRNYVDYVSKEVYGFYFGRLDIKFNDWEDLAKARDLQVIEINGAGSEPTHIYDPKHSIFFAWKEILRHWNFMYQISKYHRNIGYPALDWKEGWRMLRDHKQLEKYLFSI